MDGVEGRERCGCVEPALEGSAQLVAGGERCAPVE